MDLLQFGEAQAGVQEARIDLAALYDAPARRQFEERWPSFFASDPAHPAIFDKSGDLLRYRTLHFVPNVSDERPPLLFLMGNPASHSARARVCFSREGRQRRHRFWTVLSETGFLTLRDSENLDALEPPDRHARIRTQLLGADYESPFRIGIVPILSMPSTASAPPWSGVAGLYRLFGKRALTAILQQEKRRVHQVVQSFLGASGVIVAFQKDAYETVRSTGSPPYSFAAVRTQRLMGRYVNTPSIVLLGGPPTRFWTGQPIRRALVDLRETIEHYYAALSPPRTIDEPSFSSGH